MAFDPEFLELMPLTCTLRPPAPVGRYGGERTFGDPQAVQCHIQYGEKHVYADGRISHTEQGVVYLAGVYPVEVDWGLSLPIPGGTEDVKIVGVDQNTDEEGYHHTAVHFGNF